MSSFIIALFVSFVRSFSLLIYVVVYFCFMSLFVSYVFISFVICLLIPFFICVVICLVRVLFSSLVLSVFMCLCPFVRYGFISVVRSLGLSLLSCVFMVRLVLFCLICFVRSLFRYV